MRSIITDLRAGYEWLRGHPCQMDFYARQAIYAALARKISGEYRALQDDVEATFWARRESEHTARYSAEAAWDEAKEGVGR